MLELNEKRTLVAGLCKLMTYEIFDCKLAAPIYAQLVRVSEDEHVNLFFSIKLFNIAYLLVDPQ